MANFFYNGVKLPAAPDCDKEVYSSAYILKYDGVYVFKISTAPVTYVVNSVANIPFLAAQGAGSEIVYNSDGVSEWEYSSNADYGDGDYVASYIDNALIWTNTDIYTTDGTLYLAASDPIPVDPIDPAAMLMGWLTGKRIAGQR